MSHKRYDLVSVRVEEFQSGPRQCQRKPVSLPKGAIPCGVTQGTSTWLHYLVPVSSAAGKEPT